MDVNQSVVVHILRIGVHGGILFSRLDAENRTEAIGKKSRDKKCIWSRRSIIGLILIQSPQSIATITIYQRAGSEN